MNKLTCSVASLLLLAGSLLQAQSVPTAVEQLHLSGFAGGSGVYTGLYLGRNLAITAGADLTLRRYWLFNPSIEVRGTYPIAVGQIDSQRNVLGGLRFERPFRRIHPYVDFLYGRGRISYVTPLLDSQRYLLYSNSSSNVLSPGGGFELDLLRSFALRADVQVQRYDTPIPASGHLYAKPLTLALVYRLGAGRRTQR